MVGEREVLVAETPSSLHHLGDRRPAVGPVRVTVQVTTHHVPQRLAALDEPPVALGLELGKLRRYDAGAGLHHDGRCRGPDVHDIGQRPRGDPLRELAGGQRLERPCRLAVGLDPAGLATATLHPVGDLLQCLDGVHAPILPYRCPLSGHHKAGR